MARFFMFGRNVSVLIDEENVMLFFITLERKVGVIETSIECVGSDVEEGGVGTSRVNPILSSRSGPSTLAHSRQPSPALHGASKGRRATSKVMEDIKPLLIRELFLRDLNDGLALRKLHAARW
jgi:hypothetical protein